jgi:uncharacterized Zn finger protein
MIKNRVLFRAGARPTYRCPECGEMVNNRDPEAIRLHHDHVLHPRYNQSLAMRLGTR